MTLLQKAATVLGAVAARSDIKRLLVRRYWERRDTFTVNFEGIQAVFSTKDFYSNYWFYGPQIADGVYEAAVTRLLIQRIRGARGFIDVGANLGYFTVVAAVALKGAPVYSFEIDATLAPITQANLRLNNCNAQVVSAAVGERDKAPVPYTPHAFGFVELATGLQTAPFRIELLAPTLSLDAYFEGAQALPNFIKVDVDGAEMGVLRGMSRLLAQPDLQMLLEVQYGIDPDEKIDEILTFLHQREFRTYFIDQSRTNGGLREVRRASELSGNMLLVIRGEP
jgi:FkbM family methyltransferase